MNPLAHFIADLVYSLLESTPERLRIRIGWHKDRLAINIARGWKRRVRYHRDRIKTLGARLVLMEARAKL